MDWMDNEVEAMWRTCPDFAPPPTVVRKIATRAVELVAARGGTMAADRLTTAVSAARAGIASEVTRMVQHITAQGATVATLLVERDAFKMKVEACEASLMDAQTDGAMWEAEAQRARAEVERLKAESRARMALILAAESRLAAVRAAWKQNPWQPLGTVSSVLENGAPNSSMPSNGSGGTQKTCPGCVKCCATEQQACPDDGPPVGGTMDPTEGLPEPESGVTMRVVSGVAAHEDFQRITGASSEQCRCAEGEPVYCRASRHPCSSTCTHDDAAKPGHPERVKERSEAVKVLSETILPGPDVIDGGPGSRGPVRRVAESARRAADAYAAGAEAMRAAVEAWARGYFGEVPPTLKDAMDGV